VASGPPSSTVASLADAPRRERRAAQKKERAQQKTLARGGGGGKSQESKSERAFRELLLPSVDTQFEDHLPETFDREKCPVWCHHITVTENRIKVENTSVMEAVQRTRDRNDALRRNAKERVKKVVEEEAERVNEVNAWHTIMGASTIKLVRDPRDGYDEYYIAQSSKSVVHCGKWTQESCSVHYSTCVTIYKREHSTAEEDIQNTIGYADVMGVVYYRLAQVLFVLQQCEDLVWNRFSQELSKQAECLGQLEEHRDLLKSLENNTANWREGMEAVEILARRMTRQAISGSMAAPKSAPR